MASITADGFKKRTLEELVALSNEAFRTAFGINFDITPESPDGQIIGIVSALVNDAEEDAEAAYNSASATKTKGKSLDYVVEYNNLKRIVDKPCMVMLDVTGMPGTRLPRGVSASTASGLKFRLLEDVELPNSVAAECHTLGAINVNVGEVNRVDSRYPNWYTVTNPRIGSEGIPYEQDGMLRARRVNSIVAAGAATPESIRSALFGLGATYASVLDNDSGAEIEGQPDGTIQIVVDGGSDREIAHTIMDKRIPGIATYGSTTVLMYDSEGYPRPINFTRPTTARVYATLHLKRLAGAPTNPQEEVSRALQGIINQLQPAQLVEWASLFAPVLAVGGLRILSLTIGLDKAAQKPETLLVARTARAKIQPEDIVLVLS